MSSADLRDEVEYQLRQMQVVVRELLALRHDLADDEPTLRDLSAISSFLQQFYTGVENILKRISRFHEVPLPDGPDWHIELLARHGTPPSADLPALFEPGLANDLDVYRRFRHVGRGAYSMELDWAKLAVGLDQVADVFGRFRAAVAGYLNSLA
jgi:hypothetical protein